MLFKYFPDDVKHRKKFEKLSKKKAVEIEEEEEEEKEEREEKEEKTELQSDLRRKTLLKIKKFLTGISESDAVIQEISEKIEDYLFKTDSTIGKRYCRIAFLVLSALKVNVAL